MKHILSSLDRHEQLAGCVRSRLLKCQKLNDVMRVAVHHIVLGQNNPNVLWPSRFGFEELCLVASAWERAAIMNYRTDRSKRPGLTYRRRQVAKLACRGFSNREIAQKLGVTEGTVKTHLHAIYEKLDVRSRDELAVALMNST